jgi:hypothetical protein
MKTTHTRRRIQSIVLCIALPITSGICLAVQPLLSAETKGLISDDWVDLSAQAGRVIAMERRLCRYEQHECQLVSGL